MHCAVIRSGCLLQALKTAGKMIGLSVLYQPLAFSSASDTLCWAVDSWGEFLLGAIADGFHLDMAGSVNEPHGLPLCPGIGRCIAKPQVAGPHIRNNRRMTHWARGRSHTRKSHKTAGICRDSVAPQVPNHPALMGQHIVLTDYFDSILCSSHRALVNCHQFGRGQTFWHPRSISIIGQSATFHKDPQRLF